MDLEKQLKDLENEQERLAQMKLELREKKKLYDDLDGQMKKFLNETTFSTPKELAEAIIDKYGIKISQRKSGNRRRRTTITATLRDTVKSYVNSGQSMNAVSKQLEISYAVVVKIMKGTYDHLVARPQESAQMAASFAA